MDAMPEMFAHRHDGGGIEIPTRIPGIGVNDIDRAARYVNHEFEQKWVGAHDPVGVTFWVISMCMIASTVFFLMEANRLTGHWRTSLTVGSLVTLVAGVHYFYMREYWVTYYSSPIVYRYIDWAITVPLQMIEFYLILRSVGPASGGIFWRLMVGTIFMLVSGYLGESGSINAWVGFILGMAGWGFILQEIFNGEAGKLKAGADTPKSVQSAFNTMRSIVTIGWSIYPLGYFFGFLTGAVDAGLLNIIYNIADLVNKIGFVMAIWGAAVEELEN